MVAVAVMTIITGVVVLILEEVPVIATLKSLGQRNASLEEVLSAIWRGRCTLWFAVGQCCGTPFGVGAGAVAIIGARPLAVLYEVCACIGGVAERSVVVNVVVFYWSTFLYCSYYADS